MKKDEKIYIAGHQGLVGSAIVRTLQHSGYINLVHKTFDDLDLRNQSDVNEFFAKEKPDYVFLAAAKVGGILANSTYRAEFMYDNLIIASNIIHAAYCNHVKKLINLGSSCIYPKHAPQPLKEEYLLTGQLEPTNEPYALAKIAAIKLCTAYNQQYGTHFLSVMPTNLYGPNDNFNLETSHVLPSLIRKFHLAKLLHEHNFESIRSDLWHYRVGHGLDTCWDQISNEEIEAILARVGITQHAVTLWGSGMPRREFLHVDDLARVLLLLMEHYNESVIPEYINIGTGCDMHINDCAAIIQSIIGFQGTINFDATKPDGIDRKVLDVTFMHRLGLRAQIAFTDGVAHLYTWYVEQGCTMHTSPPTIERHNE